MKILKFYTTFLLLILNSCDSLDKDEYKIINKVTEEYVYPKTDTILFSKIRKENNFNDAVRISRNEMAQREYTFTISNTIYPAIISKNLKEELHTKLLFFEIEGRSNKSIIADFEKITFRKNMKRIPQKTNDSMYIGHFKLHRVLFDKTKERAYVQIETPENTYPSFFGLMFKKINGEWVVD